MVGRAGVSAAAGVDLTWRPRANLALSAAVLPDFGQVEADQVVINLTTTEVRFAEKRPFFLQGMVLFQTPIQLLYTRRIGRAADVPALPDGVRLIEPPGAAPVLGAAKLVAHGAGVELGAVSAVTGSADAKIDGSMSNVHHVELNLEAYSARPIGPMLETRSRIEIFGRRNLDGLAQPSGYQWNVSGVGKGLWEAFLGLHWRPRYVDDREIGDGRALERAARLGLELELSSDPHRSVSAKMALTVRGVRDGSELYANGTLALHPRDNLEIDLDPDITIARGEPRFVDGADPQGPRFARLDATSIGLTTRATWTLHRDLTLQTYVQALLATLHYRDAFVAAPADRAIDLGDLRPATFDATAYDLREGALNATGVARWEYAPGSVAFLVYSHAQLPRGDGTTFDLRALPRGPSQNVVLVKLSWAWLR